MIQQPLGPLIRNITRDPTKIERVTEEELMSSTELPDKLQFLNDSIGQFAELPMHIV